MGSRLFRRQGTRRIITIIYFDLFIEFPYFQGTPKLTVTGWRVSGKYNPT